MEEVNKQEPEIIIKETKILSFGEQLTGIDFSTEEEGSVYHVKKTMADLTNLLLDEYQKGDKSPIKSLLFDHAVGELVSAQMALVKVITFKNK
jgi:hypothetical protein